MSRHTRIHQWHRFEAPGPENAQAAQPSVPARRATKTGMAKAPNRALFVSSTIVLSLLFIGYFLTTGTGLIEDPIFREIFRFASLALTVANILIFRQMRPSHILLASILILLFTINQSIILANLLFLGLITISLMRLSARECAYAIIVPIAILILLHVLTLNLGIISSQVNVFQGRTRSYLGFFNPNQASAFYLSLCFAALIFSKNTSKTWGKIAFLVSLGALFVVTQQTDTRTAMFAALIMVTIEVANYVFRNFTFYKGALRVSALAAPITAAMATYFIATTNTYQMNDILSLRPYFFAEFLEGVGQAEILFGWHSYDRGVDNALLMLLSSVGLFGALLILGWVSYRSALVDTRFLSAFLAIMLASTVESHLIRPEIPISVIFLQLLFAPWARRENWKTRQGPDT